MFQTINDSNFRKATQHPASQHGSIWCHMVWTLALHVMKLYEKKACLSALVFFARKSPLRLLHSTLQQHIQLVIALSERLLLCKASCWHSILSISETRLLVLLRMAEIMHVCCIATRPLHSILSHAWLLTWVLILVTALQMHAALLTA